MNRAKSALPTLAWLMFVGANRIVKDQMRIQNAGLRRYSLPAKRVRSHVLEVPQYSRQAIWTCQWYGSKNTENTSTTRPG